MGSLVEYTIGRQNTDIVIADSSVSRLHAELVTADGCFYITDCGSTSGTQVYRQGDWQPIQQDFVEVQEKLRFGRKVYTVLGLLNMLAQAEGGEKKGAPIVAGKITAAKSTPDPKDALPDGKVQRDAVTGEIIGFEE